MYTVVITCSPIPSHPSTAAIEDTIRRIRAYPDLANAEIVIACDGVRPEQAHRAADYEEFRRRLLALCNWHPDFRGCFLVPSVEHQHQANMIRRALDYVETPCVFMVEADTYPLGEVDFAGLYRALHRPGVNSIRLHIYESVIPEHAHLYGEEREICEGMDGPIRLIPTWAWSQRPHVARTDWYRRIVAENVGRDARCFLEDVMYGVLTAGGREQAARWGVWLYAPRPGWPGGILRSGTSDGRGADPKFEQKFAYDGERPFGAPAPR